MDTVNVTSISPADGNITSAEGLPSPFQDVAAILTAVVLGILILTTILGNGFSFLEPRSVDNLLFFS